MATGAVLERTYKSGEKLEPADVEERKLQYIYPEGDGLRLHGRRTPASRSTSPATRSATTSRWLSDGMNVDVTLFNGHAIGVEPALARRAADRRAASPA